MKKLDLREIQLEELNLLLKFDKFCKENNLKYYLCGGTLLGAIRHKGFIPWDDDIDVAMPRPDYDKMISIVKTQQTELEVEALELDNSTLPFAKLINKDIWIKSTYLRSSNLYLWIDIFPIDGLPDSVDSSKQIYQKVKRLIQLHMLSQAKAGEGKSLLKKVIKLIASPLLRMYGGSRLGNHLKDLASIYKYESSSWVGVIAWGLGGIGERISKNEAEASVLVEFEGKAFPAFGCWETYLRGLYGNYMELPPEDKRITHQMDVYKKD